MTNLPAFLSLLRRELGSVPALLYMHENQLTYPIPPGSRRDLTYGMMQHLSMLVADVVRFNSAYHLRSWFDEMPRLLKHFPDYMHLESIEATRAKSAVLPVGCDLRRLDSRRPIHTKTSAVSIVAEGDATSEVSRAPLVLWNQRWEFDKDPETMLRALYTLAGEGLPFRVALAGESFRMQPAEFETARERLGERLVHYGYAENEADYARLLWSADVVLSTAIHEFFGVSVVEAIYCGARPVLPRRLSYPELLPQGLQDPCLYADFDGLLERLRAALGERTGAGATEDPADADAAVARSHVARFDWSTQAPVYDAVLLSMA